jgi:hypothetical protein
VFYFNLLKEEESEWELEELQQDETNTEVKKLWKESLKR